VPDGKPDGQRAYGVTNDWSVIVDQQGIIRYKQPGVNVTAINATLDELLMSTGTPEKPTAVRGFVLHQNYPNPFNPVTQIVFELIKAARVSLKVHNARGELITTLLDQNSGPGRHEVTWNARDQQGKLVASGIYFYELRVGDFSERRKMVLVQ
jgi:hypothetical protein